MTRKQLRKTLYAVITMYILVLIGGILIYYNDPTCKKIHYQIFKDLIPFSIAIPAAYLGFCFQRRSSFLQALRQLWTNLISSVNSSIQYTHLESPSYEKYGETLVLLSKSIDEVRGVYMNLKETQNHTGWFPYEALKDIHDLISELHPNVTDVQKKKETRDQIVKLWKELRKAYLSEFDRSEPTYFNSPNL